MTWARFDDLMATNPKVAPLSDAAFRLYVTAILYANQHLTDGVVVVEALHRVTPKAVKELLAARLFEKTKGGIRIHDYLGFQSSRADVLKMKEEKKKAGAAGGRAKVEAEARRLAEAQAELQRTAGETVAGAVAGATALVGPLVEKSSTHLPSPPIPSSPNGNEKKGEREGASRPRSLGFVPPSEEDVRNFAEEERLGDFNAGVFVSHYAKKDWLSGKVRLTDWKQAVKNAALEGWTTKTAAPDPPSPAEKARRGQEQQKLLDRLAERDRAAGGT